MTKQFLSVPCLLSKLRSKEICYPVLIRMDGTVVSAAFCISTKEVLPEVIDDNGDSREYCYFFPMNSNGALLINSRNGDASDMMRIKLR